jgi:hypothetical protein
LEPLGHEGRLGKNYETRVLVHPPFSSGIGAKKRLQRAAKCVLKSRRSFRNFGTCVLKSRRSFRNFGTYCVHEHPQNACGNYSSTKTAHVVALVIPIVVLELLWTHWNDVTRWSFRVEECPKCLAYTSVPGFAIDLLAKQCSALECLALHAAQGGLILAVVSHFTTDHLLRSNLTTESSPPLLSDFCVVRRGHWLSISGCVR